MKLTDFEYAGEKLSTKGCMICSFDGSNDETRVIGGDLTFNSVQNNNSFVQHKISTTYDSMYTPDSFSICKINCDSLEDSYWTQDEVRDFSKWLNRESYEKFRPIYDNVYSGVYFKGYFNVSVHEFGGFVIGFDLTFVTNAPFGFAEEIKISDQELSGSGYITINTTSDKVGYIYPKITIKCTSEGDLEINDIENRKTVVKNCSVNETITFSGETKIITTNLSSHSKLPQEFNYMYPRLKTSYTSDLNKLTFSLPCIVSIEFAPVRKVGIL